MARFSLRHWLNRLTPLSPRRRGVPGRGQRRCRLTLEWLEGRCLPSTVTNLNDAGPGSLREALASTPDGGTVDFQPGLQGTITLTTGELQVNTDLTITGPGQDVLTVSGNQATRVVDIAAGVTVALAGLTLTQGLNNSFPGGGILNAGALSLSDASVSGNIGGQGGGIYNSAGGSLTLTHVLVSDNIAATQRGQGDGGGLYNEAGGTVTITASSLQRNSARSSDPESGGIAGGIDNRGTLTITASTFTNNGGDRGGGISNGGTLTITASTFASNGSFHGGALWNTGTLTLSDSTLSNNQVFASSVDRTSNRGGGLYNAGMAVLVDVTFSGNGAATDLGAGGGIYNTGTLDLTGGTLNGNAASIGGGGGLWTSGTALLRNTIVAGNMPASTTPDVKGMVTSQGHNLIGNDGGGSGFADTDLVGTAMDPIDPHLGPLQDNGGPTLTQALLIDSPARAAGDPREAPPTDQRGARRVVQHAIDIGAYQVQPPPAPVCTVAVALLRPHHHDLVTVGLRVHLSHRADPSTQGQVLVFGNDDAQAGDAATIGPDTLQLRARRRASGAGRVYLIAVQATDASGQSGGDVCTVVVPYDHSPAAVAAVEAEAASAAAFYQANQMAPPGYALLGQGPAAGTDPSSAPGDLRAGGEWPPILLGWMNLASVPGATPLREPPPATHRTGREGADPEVAAGAGFVRGIAEAAARRRVLPAQDTDPRDGPRGAAVPECMEARVSGTVFAFGDILECH